LDLTTHKEMERQKNLMLGMTGHELKTPLAALKGMLQLAQRRLKRTMATPTQIPPEWEAFTHYLTKSLEDSVRQIDVQARLINDLLDVPRISAHTLKLSLQRCNLSNIVRQTIEDLRVTAPERSLLLELPEDPPVIVLVDTDRISQVVTNYIINALRYSGPDQPVRIGITVQEDNMVRVWVHDEGPGLSKEAQEGLWQRFHQVREASTQSSSEQGLGLGLYICQMLIGQHQGEVGVDSTPGEGSTFWFTLPLAT
ncbi:MAG: sensor histidine kinase, partial [Ktedonobacteraceae bacterium]